MGHDDRVTAVRVPICAGLAVNVVAIEVDGHLAQIVGNLHGAGNIGGQTNGAVFAGFTILFCSCIRQKLRLLFESFTIASNMRSIGIRDCFAAGAAGASRAGDYRFNRNVPTVAAGAAGNLTEIVKEVVVIVSFRMANLSILAVASIAAFAGMRIIRNNTAIGNQSAAVTAIAANDVAFTGITIVAANRLIRISVKNANIQQITRDAVAAIAAIAGASGGSMCISAVAAGAALDLTADDKDAVTDLVFSDADAATAGAAIAGIAGFRGAAVS